VQGLVIDLPLPVSGLIRQALVFPPGRPRVYRAGNPLSGDRALAIVRAYRAWGP
jgi:hypothetical protein